MLGRYGRRGEKILKLANLKILTLMELKKIYGNKRQLLIVVLGAILLCLVFSLVAHHSPKEINVTVFVDQFERLSVSQHEQTRRIIGDIDRSVVLSVYETYSLDEAMGRLDDRKSRAVIVLKEGSSGIKAVRITIDATDLTIQQAISKELRAILQRNSKQATIEFLSSMGLTPQQANPIINPFSFDIKANAWQEIRFFDSFASPLIILMVLGICLIAAVTGVTSERSRGTIERIFASPYKGSEFILGKILAHSVLAVAVSVVIVFALKLAFGVAVAKPFLALIIAILIGINGVIFGLLVSSFTYVELESVAMGISFYLLFMILMGFTWPIETMHPIFRFLSLLTPYYYGVQAIRHVSLVGWGLSQAWLDLTILCGFIVVQCLATMLILRRQVR